MLLFSLWLHTGKHPQLFINKKERERRAHSTRKKSAERLADNARACSKCFMDSKRPFSPLSPILLMGKPRQREGKGIAKGLPARNMGGQDWNPGSWAPVSTLNQCL